MSVPCTASRIYHRHDNFLFFFHVNRDTSIHWFVIGTYWLKNNFYSKTKRGTRPSRPPINPAPHVVCDGMCRKNGWGGRSGWFTAVVRRARRYIVIRPRRWLATLSLYGLQKSIILLNKKLLYFGRVELHCLMVIVDRITRVEKKKYLSKMSNPFVIRVVPWCVRRLFHCLRLWCVFNNTVAR